MSLAIGGTLLRKQLRGYWPLLLKRSKHDFHFAEPQRARIGNREIVGYGWNGCPCYHDNVEFPFPSIRFREATPEICDLREREKKDWKKLSLDEKKALYRYSFCQTFAEFKAPTGVWKIALGWGLWSIAVGVFMSYTYYLFLYGPYPETFDEDRRRAQLKRMIGLEVNPVNGLTSKWDYDQGWWK